MSDTVSALFDTRQRCDQAVELLTVEGFTLGEIEVLAGAVPGPPIEPSEGEVAEALEGADLAITPGAEPSDGRLRDGGFIVHVKASGDRRNVALEALSRGGGESFDVT